ncbi:hypothetical protein I3760_06G166200 [Carya illinoinensis]|nr:hypothetical protein I3760_06G166200 [Carya illinoinensis]
MECSESMKDKMGTRNCNLQESITMTSLILVLGHNIEGWPKKGVKDKTGRIRQPEFPPNIHFKCIFHFIFRQLLVSVLEVQIKIFSSALQLQ